VGLDLCLARQHSSPTTLCTRYIYRVCQTKIYFQLFCFPEYFGAAFFIDSLYIQMGTEFTPLVSISFRSFPLPHPSSHNLSVLIGTSRECSWHLTRLEQLYTWPSHITLDRNLGFKQYTSEFTDIWIYYIINLYICKCPCWLYFIRYNQCMVMSHLKKCTRGHIIIVV
jgi:hypothetical protein